MINRRRFSASVATAMFAFAGAPARFASASTARADSHGIPTHVVCNTHLHREFEKIVELHGEFRAVHRFNYDISTLWFDVFAERCARQAVSVVGITRHSDFFIFRTFAAECRYEAIMAREDLDHVVWRLSPLPPANRLPRWASA